MLERAFDLFERFVAAHEKLATAVGHYEKPDSITIETPLKELTAPRKTTSISEKDLDEHRRQNRDWLKGKLTEMGVDFSKKMATSTLLKKYDEAMAAKEQQKKEEKVPTTVEEMRVYLKDFVNTYKEPGRETVKRLLNELGAVNLTALDSRRYPELLQGLQQYITII
jgi:hypothetical protein